MASNPDEKPPNTPANTLIPLKQYCDNSAGTAGYKVLSSKVINILLVGRSQSGKSTLMETLIDPQQAVQGRGYSVTRFPEIKSFVLQRNEATECYNINTLDTPGLKELNLDTSIDREDDEIVRLAMRFMSKHITFLNVIIFVSKGGETHKLDLEVFNVVKAFLGETFSNNSLLILTHCESMSKARIHQIIEDLKVYPPAREIIDYCKLGILPYGTMSGDTLELCDEEETPEMSEQAKKEKVNKTLKKIEEMRKSLLEKIISTVDTKCEISPLREIEKETLETQQILIQSKLSEEKAEWEMKLKEQLLEAYEKDMNNEKNRLEAEMNAKIQHDLVEVRKESENQITRESVRLKEQHQQDMKTLQEKETLELARVLELTKSELALKKALEVQNKSKKLREEDEQRRRTMLQLKYNELLSQYKAQQEALMEQKFEDSKYARRHGHKNCALM